MQTYYSYYYNLWEPDSRFIKTDLLLEEAGIAFARDTGDWGFFGLMQAGSDGARQIHILSAGPPPGFLDKQQYLTLPVTNLLLQSTLACNNRVSIDYSKPLVSSSGGHTEGNTLKRAIAAL